MADRRKAWISDASGGGWKPGWRDHGNDSRDATKWSATNEPRISLGVDACGVWAPRTLALSVGTALPQQFAHKVFERPRHHPCLAAVMI